MAERFILTAMCEVQLKGRKGAMDLMLVLGLNETMDQLVIATSVRWNGDVLSR